MDDFDIRPLRGVGAVEFGMPPEQVRGLLGSALRSFKRAATAMFPCDYFPSLGVLGYYTAEGVLEALEFASPARILLGGRNLLGLSFDIAKNFLKSNDARFEEGIDMVIAHRTGVSLYAPLAKENPNSPCQSVLVFAEGYYD